MSKCWSIPFLITISILLGILTGESVLQIAGFSYYWAYYKRPHPDTGWNSVPGAKGWQDFEGKAYVRINSAGLRDREHAIVKPPGTVRIAVLGDSFAEAVQVPLEETFWAVLERHMQDCPALRGRVPEVINFGVSGYSTAQELLALRHRVWQYQPDIVLLAFFQGNDLTENVRTLDGNDPLRPYFVYRGSQLVLDASFRQSREYRLWTSWYGGLALALLDRSRLLQAVKKSMDVVRLRWEADRTETPADGTLQEPGVSNLIYQRPQDPHWQEAWQITEGLLAEMHQEVTSHGARFLVSTLTTGAQVHPSPFFREGFQETLKTQDLFYPEHRILALGERQGFPVLTLAPSLQGYATLHGVWLHGFENSLLGTGHWNSTGHRLAGETMAQTLCHGKFLDSLTTTHLYLPSGRGSASSAHFSLPARWEGESEGYRYSIWYRRAGDYKIQKSFT